LNQNDPTVERLEDQIQWYDRKSLYNQRIFKWLKIGEIVFAAMIPFCAGMGVTPYVTGGFGVLIVIAEGLQHLNQYQHNWISYRSTCEAPKHEKYLFLAKAGPYLSADNPLVLLADRIEGLISQEHAKWVSTHKQTKNNKEPREQ
jgi:hypothetical protein